MRASSYTCLQVLSNAVGIQPHPVPFSAGKRDDGRTDGDIAGNGFELALPSSLPSEGWKATGTVIAFRK